jgi:hypothetical protein
LYTEFKMVFTEVESRIVVIEVRNATGVGDEEGLV